MTPVEPTRTSRIEGAGRPAAGHLMDRIVGHLDTALRTVAGASSAQRPLPQAAGSHAASATEAALSDADRRESVALMRVNHVGEVCAQALYASQALLARDDLVRAQMEQAGREEVDHLAWCEARLQALGGRTSLLNPLWYGGAFAIGLAAAAAGDRVSLGFLAETERQVEAHLAGHLDQLPSGDAASRAVVEQMKDDEVQHARGAEASGAATLPWPVRMAMRGAARVMTTTARWI